MSPSQMPNTPASAESEATPRDASEQPAEAVAAAERWLAERDHHSVRLQAELESALSDLERAQRRVRLAQDALARVRASAAPLPPAIARVLSQVRDAEEEINLHDASNAEAIWFAVSAHPHGVTAGDIQQWTAARGKAMTPKYVHTYLHRMLKDARIAAEGLKGSRRYFLGAKGDVVRGG